jgi:benzoyl-CoA reductase/2-hydroxyglutaryl-CoA dehydratase subunit BcrC/BadD/HgdB
MFNDRVSVDEWFLNDMIDSIADKYLKGCTCPIFTKNDDRIRRIVDLVRSYGADGVVYQAFAGCQVYEMEQRSVLAAMEKEGIAILYVESDYSPSQQGQLTTRVEAFVESLKNRRRMKK